MTISPILTELFIAVKSKMYVGCLKIYLFGSTLRAKAVWSDIDILVLYESEEDRITARDSMSHICMHYPIDLILMSFQEEEEFDFIRSEGCKEIFTNNFCDISQSKLNIKNT